MGFLKNTIHRHEDLTTALRQQTAYLLLSITDYGDLTGRAVIVLRIASGVGISGGPRFLIRTWIADADMSEPDAQTAFGVGSEGEQMYEHEEFADYTVITNAGCAVYMNIELDASKKIYVMAEIDGRIYSSFGTITGP